jgi:hypothetical protein
MNPAQRETVSAFMKRMFPGQTFFVFVQTPNPGQPDAQTHYITNVDEGAARSKRLPATLKKLAKHFEAGDFEARN